MRASKLGDLYDWWFTTHPQLQFDLQVPQGWKGNQLPKFVCPLTSLVLWHRGSPPRINTCTKEERICTLFPRRSTIEMKYGIVMGWKNRLSELSTLQYCIP